MSNDKREQRRQETLKTADNHRQPWTEWEDSLVIGPTSMTNVEIAVQLGRTSTAVSQRRVVLRALFNAGYSFGDIHEVEAHNRLKRKAARMDKIIHTLRETCDECFCSPHTADCSKGA